MGGGGWWWVVVAVVAVAAAWLCSFGVGWFAGPLLFWFLSCPWKYLVRDFFFFFREAVIVRAETRGSVVQCFRTRDTYRTPLLTALV